MKYRKKPVVIEAIKYDGANHAKVQFFCGGIDLDTLHGTQILIETLEGKMAANPGDWIIKGIKGEFYPCKPDIFEATYEKENNNQTQGDSKMGTHYLMQFFGYSHLPENLKQISVNFYNLALIILDMTPDNPERTTALRKLLEAKDCAVRASIFK